MACDGVRYGCKFSGPLTERSKGKPKQTRITCGTQSKIVLSQGVKVSQGKSEKLAKTCDLVAIGF